MDPNSSSGQAQLGESSSHPSQQAPSNAIVPAKIRVPTKASRRNRGEIACAECRRLKIRCDRIIPCSTCVKRGCGALCPNGTIPPGEGSRFVLAAEDHLQHKITKMEARMRSLEDALAIVHGPESGHPHPLLVSVDEEFEDDVQDVPMLQPVREEEPQTHDSLSDALGTLYLDAQGGTRFFGPTGGSESLLTLSEDLEQISPTKAPGPTLQELDPSYLSTEINLCYQSFPFTPPNVVAASVQPTIESYLPSMERAIILCDTFLEHLSWMFHIVSRHKLVNELIPIIYKQVSVTYGPHDLALLLIVLAIGSLVDLNLPPYNLEAQHYYRLCRATLALQPVLGAQSIVTIKTLHLMSIYYGASGKESNLEQSYLLLDLAGQVALRIGFHIDPSMWGFEGREAYDRRVYFWNLMAAVLWQSLVVGRPPSLLMSYIDCRIPTSQDEDLFQAGEVPLGFGIWGFRASQECLIPLVRAVLAAKPPTYETVMELDRKIRNLFGVQRSDDFPGHTDRTAISMRIFVRSHYQDLMLLFLHRAHFAQAMSEYPENPLSSPYSHSVRAAYSSACVVLQDTRNQFMKKPALCARIWRMWSFAFSASVVVGAIAVRGVHLNLKPPPLEEFEENLKVFTSAAETSNRAAKALPVLRVMLQKAYQAHRYYQERGKPAPSQDADVDELSYFGGRKAVIKQEDSSPLQQLSKPFQTSAMPSAPAGPNASHLMSRHHPPHKGSMPQVPLAAASSTSITLPPLTYPSTPTSYTKSISQSTQRQASTSSSLSSRPQVPPLITSGMPVRQQTQRQAQRRQSQQECETFAELSGGWNGLFHEVPGPQYGLYGGSSSSYASTSQHMPGRSRSTTVDAGHAGASSPQSAVSAQGGDTLMLDDRWASFMNYGVLRGPAPQYPSGHSQPHQ